MLAVPSILIGRPSKNAVAWGGGRGYREGGRGGTVCVSVGFSYSKRQHVSWAKLLERFLYFQYFPDVVWKFDEKTFTQKMIIQM